MALAELQRNHFKQVCEQENETIYYKEKAQNHEDMDKKEGIDLCGESQTMTRYHWKAKRKKKRENHDKKDSKTVTRKANIKGLKKTFKPKKW